MVNRWLFRCYNLLVLCALPFIGLGIILRWRHRVFNKGAERWSERWGRLSSDQLETLSQGKRWWWVHVASLGEVKAIEPFLRRVPERAGVQVVLTAITPEALEWASTQKLAHLILAAPIDLPFVVRRVSRRIQPEFFISVESEFWPNLLREARRVGAKVALINGRMSERSFRRYRFIQRALLALWENMDLVAVREEDDYNRFASLQVPKNHLVVTGNLKYDLPLPSRDNGTMATNPSAPVIVMGSTREGEEKQLLPIINQLRKDWPQLRAIWAPRHVERVSELESLLKASGSISVRKSAMERANQDAPNVIWDTVGDLLDAYRQADVALVGGSFVPKGGQNPLEPAALELPVIFGPSMSNFRAISEALVEGGGARQVSLEGLESCLEGFLRDPQLRANVGRQARLAVERRQGATDKTIDTLLKLRHANTK